MMWYKLYNSRARKN